MSTEFDEKKEELTLKYTSEQEAKIRTRTNRSFRILLTIEWVVGILVAFFVSPKTWTGPISDTHIHIWTSIFLGAAIVLPPIVLIGLNKSSKKAPYLVACSQMLFGSLLIHLMAGRIEAHFYIFGSLAFLATYRDWRILIPATAIVAVDHIFRGIYWPQSAYGVLTGAEWRWVEHAAWVVFEDIFLIISIVQGQSDTKEIADRRSTLEIRHERIEALMSELKEKQSQLVQTAKLASLGEMTSGIAHELNNPLHFINGFNNRIKKAISKIEDDTDTKSLKNYSERIGENCERMRKIIDHFREFSRLSEHKLEPVKPQSIVERSLVLFNEQLRLKNIAISKELSSDDVLVYADENRIEQVVMNLISNARDVLEGQENAEIAVRTRAEDKWFIIEVQDNGSGIPDDVLEKIFNPFFTTKEVGKGTGLGLSISHGIIEEHSGELACQSEIGVGTAFSIKLPIYEEKNELAS